MNYRDLTHCKPFPPHQHQGEKAPHRVDVIGKKLCCPLGSVKASSSRVGELLTQDLGSGLPRSPDCWQLALLSPMAFRCQPKFQAQLIVWHVTLAQRKRRKENKEPVRRQRLSTQLGPLGVSSKPCRFCSSALTPEVGLGSEPPVHLIPRKAGKGLDPFKEREKTDWAWLSLHWPKGDCSTAAKGCHGQSRR